MFCFAVSYKIEDGEGGSDNEDAGEDKVLVEEPIIGEGELYSFIFHYIVDLLAFLGGVYDFDVVGNGFEVFFSHLDVVGGDFEVALL